ncbi:hypothetical protein NL533_33495, partial [Klebsiella pneumoniae]|nr:hypothetical protein [Klebsiella pneumoniae]
EGVVFSSREIADTPLAKIQEPGKIAAEVVSGLNRNAAREEFQLVNADHVSYRGDYATAICRTGGKSFTVLIDVRDGTGFARQRQ